MVYRAPLCYLRDDTLVPMFVRKQGNTIVIVSYRPTFCFELICGK